MQGRKRQVPLTRILWFSALLLSLAGFLLFGRPASGDCEAVEQTASLARLAGQQGQRLPENTAVTVVGTVTGVFPGRDGLNGFFIQHTEHGKPAGLFVYAPAFTPADWSRIKPGTNLLLKALTDEYRGRPQLHRVESVQVCKQASLPEPVPVHLPVDKDVLDGLHGVLVHFPQTLTVTGNYMLGRYGSLRLSADGRQFRHQVPDSAFNQIILDDGQYRADPEPIPYLNDQGTRRVGDRVEDLAGVLVHAFDDWRVHPLAAPRFDAANPRRLVPEPVQGLKVATFNLENYFLSLGERGARDAAALDRQRSKLLAALEAKDADLLALVELENSREALDDLIGRLNARLPPARAYRLMDGPADTGSDAIKVAVAYRPHVLEPLGEAQADNRPIHDRPPVMTAFRNRQSGERLLAAVVHFKSKSGCPDTGDIERGQGCWNQRRTSQARALVDAVQHQSRNQGIARILLAGDFNAYTREDPVKVLEQAGYINVAAQHLPLEHRYTYVFQGQAGMLDYIFVSPALAGDVTGATIWHINADEPDMLDYDGREGRSALSRDQPWRSSDHDPVIIGLDR